jgi:hypothetical protein
VAVTTLTVGSDQELEVTVANYVTQGFMVINKTPGSATVRRPKQFNVLLAVLGLLFCGVGLLVYAIIYSLQSDTVVQITVVERQREPQPRLTGDGRWWWDGQAWQDTQVSVPPGVRRSNDGTQWWDGTTWRPVPASERMWSGGTKPGETADGDANPGPTVESEP